jgi:hypothetical protein
VVERDLACCGNCPLQAPQRRHSRSLVGGELQETNPCFFVWFSSLSYFSSIFNFFRFDLLGCATCVCAGLITLLVIIYKVYSPSLVHARSQEVLEVFLQVLCATLI